MAKPAALLYSQKHDDCEHLPPTPRRLPPLVAPLEHQAGAGHSVAVKKPKISSSRNPRNAGFLVSRQSDGSAGSQTKDRGPRHDEPILFHHFERRQGAFLLPASPRRGDSDRCNPLRLSDRFRRRLPLDERRGLPHLRHPRPERNAQLRRLRDGLRKSRSLQRKDGSRTRDRDEVRARARRLSLHDPREREIPRGRNLDA